MPEEESPFGGISKESLIEAIRRRGRYFLGQDPHDLSSREVFMALCLAVRHHIVDLMLATRARYSRADVKRVYYLSMEFLMGRSLRNNLYNLGVYELSREALAEVGLDLDALERMEEDAALGNGGLGRLAACFLDSLATLDMPGFGYGINYEYGLFKQALRSGYQRELPDHWLAFPTPWEIERPDEIIPVPLYGWVEDRCGRQGQYRPTWTGWRLVRGVPYDMPVVGYGGRTVNVLRLYSARASHDFDMEVFNEGDFFAAVDEKIASETISKVLYPTDVFEAGLELRLVQEYFLVACAIRDILRGFKRTHTDLGDLPNHVAIQLNDTHPALAVAELMRMLVDENHLDWDTALEITRATFGYTNHTLMPEALERWSVALMSKVLPRHLQIIHEINRRFLEEVSARWPGEEDRLRRMSIIEEGPKKKVRMAHLCVVGGHSVNGVAALHSELVRSRLLPDFHELWPERFNNKTNGVTTRRWLLCANPELAALITEVVGKGWVTDLDQARELEPRADDPEFRERFLTIKHANKGRLAQTIKAATGVVVDPASLFDIHVKRIHEYKRQLLNVMHIVYRYLKLVEDGEAPHSPRTFIFAGKAAPGYHIAKQIIKLINCVADVVNNDPRVDGMIRVVFIPDYRVTLAERIIPAADLSEQISTAGTEASGTGNMKLSMNGALTIGTLDGANIEIREEVGEDSFYLFGLNSEEATALRLSWRYDPRAASRADARVARVMAALTSNQFCPNEPGLLSWIGDVILNWGDTYLHMADLPSYIDAQTRVGLDFGDRSQWATKAIVNVARMGKFSSDRTIREYARDIWGIEPVG